MIKINYAQTKKISEEEFKRLSGIKKETYKEMVKELRSAEKLKKQDGGKPNKLSINKRIFMWLEYMREYRTYFHIAKSYGISESACYRNCVWIENTLIKSKKFSLPGKKALIKSDMEYEVVLIDATESHIERPKKNETVE